MMLLSLESLEMASIFSYIYISNILQRAVTKAVASLAYWTVKHMALDFRRETTDAALQCLEDRYVSSTIKT